MSRFDRPLGLSLSDAPMRSEAVLPTALEDERLFERLAAGEWPRGSVAAWRPARGERRATERSRAER
ncbi:MAG: hypothetical protein AAF533_25735 [Acidobacteriota bacterium]